MLACRPMLCFAMAVMGGVILARFLPGSADFLPYGWLLFAALAAWFILTPKPQLPAEVEGLPAGYAGHILPRPGFFARRGLNRLILVASLAVFLLGMMRQEAWQKHLARDTLPDKRWFDANLLALSPIREHAGEDGTWRMPALLLTADGQSQHVPVRLSGPAGAAFRRGDLLQARVRREMIFPKPFPGAFDIRFWMERDGLAAALAVEKARRGGAAYTVVAIDDPPFLTRIRRLIDTVRAEAIAVTLKRGGDDGGMLAAMLYGYRKDMGSELRDAFRRVGIGHVLAISGLHVGLIVGLLWWLSGWVGRTARWRAAACLVLAIFYLGLAGGQVAASRATLMAVIHLGGIALGRKSDMMNSLGAAAFFLTFQNPTAPLDISFLLSFTAVVFIFMAMRRDPDRERPPAASRIKIAAPRWRKRLEAELSSLVWLSVSTWFGLFPIIAMVFYQVNLIGLPINIFVIPLMSLVLAGGLLLPWLGWIPGMAWLLCLPSRVLTWTALWADRLPYSSFPAHAPGTAWVFVFYLFILLLLLRGMLPTASIRRWWRYGALAGIVIAFAGMVAGMRSAPPPSGGRIAVLPGRGGGVIAAESESGAIALLGNLGRGGLSEAGWLHSLRRGGGVGVVSLGEKGEGELSSLAYHYPVTAFTKTPSVDKAASEAAVAWSPIPGADGIEYAVSRDARGKIVWLAARTGKRSVCLSPGLTIRQLQWRLERGIPGFDAELLCLEFNDKTPTLPFQPLPGGRVGISGRYRGELPEGWFARRGFGTLVVEKLLRGFDGEEWRPVP